jgi:hypothetical protein
MRVDEQPMFPPVASAGFLGSLALYLQRIARALNKALVGWVDIDFPIVVRNAAANQPTPTTLKGNITAPAWAVNDYFSCDAVEMIHSWREGSDVHWHIHVVTNGLDATNRYLKFEVEWVWALPNGALSATTTTTSGELLIPASSADRTHLVFLIETVNFAGSIGSHVWARLKRVAATGTAPTANPFCSMLQMHVQVDSHGSSNVTSK